jgi:tryptophan synthase alpha chain
LTREARVAGIDGVLITDIPPEEASEVSSTIRENDMDMIFLVAPTSTDARLRLIAKSASGFIYAVSRTGVTGPRANVTSDAEHLVARVRQVSHLPIAVGFGISTAEQVADVWRYADAAVVGSAIVARIEKLKGASNIVRRVGEFTRGLIPGTYG